MPFIPLLKMVGEAPRSSVFLSLWWGEKRLQAFCGLTETLSPSSYSGVRVEDLEEVGVIWAPSQGLCFAAVGETGMSQSALVHEEVLLASHNP